MSDSSPCAYFDTDTALGAIYPFRSRTGPLVGIGGGPGSFLTPAQARQAAAVLAAYADAADREPDPEDVRALATVLEEAGCVTGDTAGLARAVLLAGYKREVPGA